MRRAGNRTLELGAAEEADDRLCPEQQHQARPAADDQIHVEDLLEPVRQPVEGGVGGPREHREGRRVHQRDERQEHLDDTLRGGEVPGVRLRGQQGGQDDRQPVEERREDRCSDDGERLTGDVAELPRVRPPAQHEVAAQDDQGHDPDDDPDRDRDREEGRHRRPDHDQDDHPGCGQPLTEEVQGGDRAEPKLRSKRDGEALLEELEDEADAGQDRARDERGRVPGGRSERHRSEGSDERQDQAQRQDGAHQCGAAALVADGVLANADGGEATLRGERGNADHRLHRREAAEAHHAEVSEKERRRQEREHAPAGEAERAHGRAANDLGARVRGIQNVSGVV